MVAGEGDTLALERNEKTSRVGVARVTGRAQLKRRQGTRGVWRDFGSYSVWSGSLVREGEQRDEISAFKGSLSKGLFHSVENEARGTKKIGRERERESNLVLT